MKVPRPRAFYRNASLSSSAPEAISGKLRSRRIHLFRVGNARSLERGVKRGNLSKFRTLAPVPVREYRPERLAHFG